MRARDLLLLAAPLALAETSARRALGCLLARQQPRPFAGSSAVRPDDPALDRFAVGSWTGTFSPPVEPHPGLPPTPVQLAGPVHFPLAAGRPADFTGWVDAPFASLEGWAGAHELAPGMPDPASLFADGGVNWGRYGVVGSVAGATQFVAPVAANRSWSASVASVPPGDWTFQLVTWASAADFAADTGRIPVGAPWRESERPGDVRRHAAIGHVVRPPQFTAVAVERGATVTIAGTLAAYAATPGRTLQILVTEETDVEYAWALQPVAAAGAFVVARALPLGGALRLRLVEQIDGCSVRQVGPVWAEENAAAAAAHGDLGLEYRAIGAAIPVIADESLPAPLDGNWSVTLRPPAVGRIALVDLNTRRVLGEWTMASGLMRSYAVAAEEFGQTTAEVYHEAFNDTCFLYDQAVALIALLQVGAREAAAALVAALLSVQNPDGSFGFARNQATVQAHDASLIRNGSEAWVCYALLLADRPAHAGWFAVPPGAAARACLDRILAWRNPLGLVNGGNGVPWWSTEHNIDAWWCLDLADRLYGSAAVDYRAAADAIRAALLADGIGWDPGEGIFWQGGVASAGGGNTPDGAHALDTHSWGAVLLQRWGETARAEASVARAYARYYLSDAATGLAGFTTFLPADGYPPSTVTTPWYEGGFGMVLALRGLDPPRANGLLATLARGQNADGSYPYALRDDPVNDIHRFASAGAAAWNVLAWSGAGTPHARQVWS